MQRRSAAARYVIVAYTVSSEAEGSRVADPSMMASMSRRKARMSSGADVGCPGRYTVAGRSFAA